MIELRLLVNWIILVQLQYLAKESTSAKESHQNVDPIYTPPIGRFHFHFVTLISFKHSYIILTYINEHSVFLRGPKTSHVVSKSDKLVSTILAKLRLVLYSPLQEIVQVWSQTTQLINLMVICYQGNCQ